MTTKVNHHPKGTSAAKLPSLPPMSVPLAFVYADDASSLSVAAVLSAAASSADVSAHGGITNGARISLNQIRREINGMKDGHRKGDGWAIAMKAAATEIAKESGPSGTLTRVRFEKALKQAVERLKALNVDSDNQLSPGEFGEHTTAADHAVVQAAHVAHWAQEG